MGDSEVLEPAGRRERTKLANRQAILAAARRVFAELGYDGASVRDIIRGTDLASGTFYNYFRSKEEVFEALSDDSARRFKPLLRAARENSRTFEEYLHGALRAYFQFLLEEHAAEGRPIDERQPHVRTDTPEMMAIYDEARQGLEEVIARGMAPRVDADYLACACIGIAQEIGAAMLRRSSPRVEEAVQFAAGLILGGLNSAPRKA